MLTKTEDDWIKAYERQNALWIHDGNKNRPHVVLRSGLHSNGFFNSRPIVSNDILLQEGAAHLFTLLTDNEGLSVNDIDGVIGPQTGATNLSKWLSRLVAHFRRDICLNFSPMKNPEDEKRDMIYKPHEIAQMEGKRFLFCEDVLTTGGSVLRAVGPVIKSGGHRLPYVLVLVNRSGQSHVDGMKIVALIDRDLPQWKPEECPLCKENSKPLQNAKDHWDELNADYSAA